MTHHLVVQPDIAHVTPAREKTNTNTSIVKLKKTRQRARVELTQAPNVKPRGMRLERRCLRLTEHMPIGQETPTAIFQESSRKLDSECFCELFEI